MSMRYPDEYAAAQRPFRRGGPEPGEIEIIGVEFTIRKPNGEVEELRMFATPDLIIPRVRSGPGAGYGGVYQPRITFHTNIGDYTLEDLNGRCPW